MSRITGFFIKQDLAELAVPTHILTNRFILRPLNMDDVSNQYLNWLQDRTAQKYISAAASQLDLAGLRKYVMERIGNDDVMFLGIFEKMSGLHIGNIKYEPVNSELGYAIMGILIGEREWRGKGAASEVILASAEWLYQYRCIRQIILGVSRTNIAAIHAYSKAGFVEEKTSFFPNVSSDGLTMVLHLHSS